MDRARLVNELILDEGLRLKPYVDTVGKTTIGVGRNLTDVGLTRAEALELLDHDIDTAVADCATFPWFMKFDGVRQLAIVSFRFNVGPTKFRMFKGTLAALAAGDPVEAGNRLTKTKWYTQVKTRGVRIVAMLRTGKYA